ncbi:hypothetical protein BP5796_05126 [Coleophoma crateriformis]|uniref:Thiamin pyrophosphokinase thiamin-binding domain-containing protein n=1 Tax=Coleophoma crateriformis TaxID=565419 RepID=A0A3D8S2D3_9HELO|nr:hypothetical protein BP5796_05126 [Coleophoma crateriformis]
MAENSLTSGLAHIAISSSESTEWRPAHIFASEEQKDNLYKNFGVVVLNQELGLPNHDYKRLWDNSTIVIAADGGANRVHEKNKSIEQQNDDPDKSLFLDLDVIIGDLDSLDEHAQSYWLGMSAHIEKDGDQYSTDFTKAVNYLRDWDKTKLDRHIAIRAAKVQPASHAMPPKDIVCIGGIGGRVDQGLSQLHHLYLFQSEPKYEKGRMFLVSQEGMTFVLKKGKHRIQVRDPWLGKYIGIIPINGPSKITTDGLEWDVTDWETSFGGQMSTSNHVREEWVEIETTNDVLFTISLKTPSPLAASDATTATDSEINSTPKASRTSLITDFASPRRGCFKTSMTNIFVDQNRNVWTGSLRPPSGSISPISGDSTVTTSSEDIGHRTSPSGEGSSDCSASHPCESPDLRVILTPADSEEE